ncbi:MAG: hypothetical protein ACK51L_03110, partial [bacterium]
KWSDRTRIGINLGYSSRHAHNVSLILSLQTGLFFFFSNIVYSTSVGFVGRASKLIALPSVKSTRT